MHLTDDIFPDICNSNTEHLDTQNHIYHESLWFMYVLIQSLYRKRRIEMVLNNWDRVERKSVSETIC